MHWRGPTFHQCCGMAIPAGARRKRDVPACDTATPTHWRPGAFATATMQRFARATLTTPLTTVGAKTANRINHFSQLSFAGRSIQVPQPARSPNIIKCLPSARQKIGPTAVDQGGGNGDLTGKVALMTGAQQGSAGRQLSHLRARADVVINHLDDVGAAEDVAAEVHSMGQRAVLAKGDVAGSGTPARLVEATVAAFGKIDILVNNAGVFPRVPSLEMTETDWDLVHSINLKASCLCAQAAARSMVASGLGGVIIRMASSAIFGASQRGVHHSASKDGVTHARYGLELRRGRFV
jgi:NADP-dependent 3-hydroxy acid dehydrogenase YdfG